MGLENCISFQNVAILVLFVVELYEMIQDPCFCEWFSLHGVSRQLGEIFTGQNLQDIPEEICLVNGEIWFFHGFLERIPQIPLIYPTQ